MKPATRPDLVLLEFDTWANARLFDACELLDNTALDREFEMGLGSIRKSLLHNLGALIGWTGVLQKVEDPFAGIREENAHSIEEYGPPSCRRARRFMPPSSPGALTTP